MNDIPPSGAAPRGRARCRRPVRHRVAGQSSSRPSPVRASALLLFGLLCLATRAAAQAPATTVLLVDREFTVGSAASIAVGTGDLVAALESRFVPDRLLEERGRARRAANIAYRTAKLFLFDVPQEELLLVVNHEIAGHGGRLRELFDGSVSYHIEPPHPYGGGGGVTFYDPARDPTVHELQAVSIGGMEANAVGASLLSRRALGTGQLTPRAALRYLTFELDIFDYVRGTDDDPERPGHDVYDFVVLYNLAGSLVDADRLTPRMLRREVWISLANPMIASAAIAIGRYLATGRESSPVLALPLGEYRVMPALRYRLAPYGTEWIAGADIAVGDRVAQTGLRVGRAPLTTPWGLFVAADGWRAGGWRMGVAGDVWRQPPLALGPARDFGASTIGDDLELGLLLRGRAESPAVRLWRVPLPLAFVVEAGAKTEGFVPGERLGGGLVLRAGLGLPLGRQ